MEWSVRDPTLRKRLLKRAVVCAGRRLLLPLWAVTALLLVGSLGIGHSAALPKPARSDGGLAGAVAAHRRPEERGFLALHVLYAACRCSDRIVDHLLARGARSDLAEAVLLVGGGARSAALSARGYRVSAIAPRELGARFHIASAPLLVVAAPDHSLRYVGGYTARKQGAEVLDQRVFQAVLLGDALASIPIFGCAVNRELQRMLDPFGLKYANAQGGT